MAITAAMVKELREKTGAGMMDCKKMLTETNGDIEQALIKLREKGLAAAAKKSGRIAAEGLVGIAVDGAKAAMAEVNCETDFVAKNADFQGLVEGLAKQAMGPESGAVADGVSEDAARLTPESYVADASKTVEAAINEKVATIGEKITFRRFVRLDGGEAYGAYKHGGGSIGVLVRLKLEDASKAASETVQTLARDLAMHVAASAPLSLQKEDLAPEIVERERAIFTQQVIDAGKPEAIAPKIVEGKIARFYKESCFLEQVFVKDPSTTVTKLLDSVSKDLGTKIEVTGFVRFKVGEGIEKKADDFAEEVARMAQ